MVKESADRLRVLSKPDDVFAGELDGFIAAGIAGGSRATE
jgi:hypothetical protein